MKQMLKKMKFVLLAVISVLSLVFGVGCGSGGSSDSADNENESLNTFYETVVSSQTCLDIVADDIYRNWYDAIYKDKYSGSIDLAIAYALSTNSDNLATIEANEPIIHSAYKSVRDSKLSAEVKAVMNVYSDYYEFVVNVSGSFNTFSASKETLKKELASALKKLALEM